MPASVEAHPDGLVCKADFKIRSYPRELEQSPSTVDFYKNLQGDLDVHCEKACSNGKHCRIMAAYKRVEQSMLSIEQNREEKI